MTIEQLLTIITNNGIGIAVVIYFLWKDSTLTKENTSLLNEVRTLLQVLLKNQGMKEEEIKAQMKEVEK